MNINTIHNQIIEGLAKEKKSWEEYDLSWEDLEESIKTQITKAIEESFEAVRVEDRESRDRLKSQSNITDLENDAYNQSNAQRIKNQNKFLCQEK